MSVQVQNTQVTQSVKPTNDDGNDAIVEAGHSAGIDDTYGCSENSGDDSLNSQNLDVGESYSDTLAVNDAENILNKSGRRSEVILYGNDFGNIDWDSEYGREILNKLQKQLSEDFLKKTNTKLNVTLTLASFQENGDNDLLQLNMYVETSDGKEGVNYQKILSKFEQSNNGLMIAGKVFNVAVNELPKGENPSVDKEFWSLWQAVNGIIDPAKLDVDNLSQSKNIASSVALLGHNGKNRVISDLVKKDSPGIDRLMNNFYSTINTNKENFNKLSEQEKLDKIMNYMKEKFTYKADKMNEGWKNLLEMGVTSDGNFAIEGDCEDLAVATANMMLAAGISKKNISLVINPGTKNNQGHVNLAVKLSNGEIMEIDPTSGKKAITSILNSNNSEAMILNLDGKLTSLSGEAIKKQVVFENGANSIRTAAKTLPDDYSKWADSSKKAYLAMNGLKGNTSKKTGIEGAIDVLRTEGFKNVDIWRNKVDVDSTIHNTGALLSGIYNTMMLLAQYMADDSSAFNNPGSLFLIQQHLQTFKDQIAAITSMGKTITDTLSEHIKQLSQDLKR